MSLGGNFTFFNENTCVNNVIHIIKHSSETIKSVSLISLIQFQIKIGANIFSYLINSIRISAHKILGKMNHTCTYLIKRRLHYKIVKNHMEEWFVYFNTNFQLLLLFRIKTTLTMSKNENFLKFWLICQNILRSLNNFCNFINIRIFISRKF